MPTCVNLAERFGDRFKIGFDPAYDPKGRRRKNLDPWYMVIPCRHGHIYPHGDRMLGFASNRRGPVANRLVRSGLVTVTQDGDDGINAIFPVNAFEQVAAIVKPQRRRRVSAEQREAARRRMLQLRSKFPSPRRL